MNKTGVVLSLDDLSLFKHILAPAAFVAQRPHNYARAVEVLADKSFSSVSDRLPEAFVFGDESNAVVGVLRTPFEVVIDLYTAVRFQIRLGDNVESVFVAKTIEKRCAGVVGGADRIHIMLLHKLKIAAHLTLRGAIARVRIAVVSVYAVKLYRLSVKNDDTVFDRYASEAYFFTDDLAVCFYCQAVKCRAFR